MVKSLVIRTAGTNCDLETKFALELAKSKVSLWHMNKLKNNPAGLLDFNIICFPGGFTYGDDISAGKVFANQLKFWFKDYLLKFIEKGGIILGICNGFQILVKTGILPDLDFEQKVSLVMNNSGKFESRWVYLKSDKNKISQTVKDIWIKGLPDIIHLPVAHGEGKFYADKNVLEKLEDNKQIIFKYVDSKGEEKGYPCNPNGSMCNIAGISDATGKVLALMPHPERCIYPYQMPLWQQEETSAWGIKIFENAVNYFK